MRGHVMRRIAFAVILMVAVTLLGAPTAAASTSWLSGHVQNLGWVDGHESSTVPGAATVGTTGQSLRLEALRINDTQAGLLMQGHVQDLGWGPESTATVGTTGRSLRLEAIRVWSPRPQVVTHCQAHVQDLGWLPEVTGGETCGTTGRSLRLEAVRIWVTLADTSTDGSS